jgi:hypothetical protein
MKNLHVLTTDKPNFGKYLVLNKEGKLCIWNTNTMGSQKTLSTQHIYITNDEEIKEGDWYFKDGVVGKCNKYPDIINGYNVKKIILTTDPDLIKDGVQDIDDEFLEWFVKNPSCEKVKWDAYPISPNGNIVATNKPYPFEGLVSNFKISYKIIIPKEEPNYNMKQEILAEMERLEEKPKQEILEEAAITYSELLPFVDEIVTDNSRLDFIAGAKWQAERMYSEEEVLKLLIYCKDKFGGGGLEDYVYDSEVKDWFEQFKKE